MTSRLRGLLALVGIVAVVAGVPWLLLSIGQSPVPASWPGWSDIWGAISRPDDGTVFLVLFRYAAWLAWLFFTLCLVLEVGARLVGGEAPDLPGLALPQGAARSLVATAALLFIAAPALTSMASSASASTPSTGSTAAPSLASVAAHELATAAATAHADSSAQTGAEAVADQDTTTHVVQPGETLWSIAESQLGDGTRYTEILALNPSISSSHWISAGSSIEIPDDGGSATDDGGSTTDDGGSTTRTVQQGDTLWDIAEDELGDGTRYTEIVDATGDQTQPDGGRLTDPDLVQPGWQVSVPGADETTAAPPSSQAAPTPAPAAAAPSTSADSVTEAGASTAGAVAASTTGSQEAGAAGASSSATTGSAAAAQTATSDSAAQSDPVLVADPASGWGSSAVGLGGLTAVGVLSLLAAARRRAARRGAHVDTDTDLLEDALLLVADGHSRDSVDIALRHIAQVAREHDRAVPGLRSVRLTREHIDVQLDSPMQLPAPWTSTADPRLWSLSSDRARTLDLAVLETVVPPYPALVSLGLDGEEAHVLVNLAHAQTFTVSGDDEATRAVVAAMALDLTSAPWAASSTVTVVGGDPRLVAAIGSPRLRYVPDVDAYFVSPSVSEDQSAREVLLVSGRLGAAESDRLHRAAASSPRISLVHTADTADTEAWGLAVGDDPDAAVLTPALLQLRAQHADDATVRAVVDLFALATQSDAYWAAPDDEPTLATVGAAAAAMGSPGVVVGADGQVLASSDDDLPTRRRVEELTRPSRAPLRWNTPVASSRGRAEDDTEAQVETVRRSADGWTASASTPRWLSTQVTPTPGTPLPPVIPFPMHLGDLAAPTDGPVLRLLGPVDIDNVPAVQAAHRARLTELAAYLNLHPAASDAELDDAMWPNRSSHDHARVRESSLAALGDWIGDTESSRPDDGRRSATRLVSDWSLWQQLVPGTAGEASSEQLEQALGLVRGRPFVGTRSRHYVWAVSLREDMIEAICAAAYELGRRRLMDGRWSAAYDATVVGLTVEPSAEPLWRLQVLAASEMDDDVREAAVTGLRQLGGSDDLDLDVRSRDLLDQLADTLVPSVRGAG